MNSKQRAELRGHANTMEPCCYLGKDGLTDSAVDAVRQALTARELIKISVQETCPLSAREACEELAEMLGAEPVQAIGRRFVLYKFNKDYQRFGIK